MIIETRHCHCCQSINIVLNGHTAQGKQRYKCKDCGATRVLDPKPPITSESVAALERSNSERLSYRAMGRIFKVSHVTVFNHLKKKWQTFRHSRQRYFRHRQMMFWKWMKSLPSLPSKSFKSVFGLFSVGGRDKSLLSLSEMEVWKVARLSGENFPTIINDAWVSAIFGEPTIAYLRKRTHLLEKNQGKPTILSDWTTPYVNASVD